MSSVKLDSIWFCMYSTYSLSGQPLGAPSSVRLGGIVLYSKFEQNVPLKSKDSVYEQVVRIKQQITR